MKLGELIHWDEAGTMLNEVEDPITRRLLSRALTIARHKFYSREEATRSENFDLLFFAQVLCDLFRDHDLIRSELNGERPGAWSEDEREYA